MGNLSLNFISKNSSFETCAETKNLINNDPWTVENSKNLWEKNNSSIYVFSSFAVTKGVFFYEVKLLKGIEIQIGFITRLVEISENNKYFVRNTQSATLKKKKTFVNDIFGCLVNIEQNFINFYYNGKLINVKYDKNIFNNTPIFAVVLVAYEHAVQVNFGQKKFKYSKNIGFYETFHSVTRKNDPSFQIQTENNIEWFCKKKFNFAKHVYVYNQNNLKMPLYFFDSEQKHFNNAVFKIEKMINNKLDYQNVTAHIIEILINLKYENILFRFLQSIVEVIGYKIESNKTSMLDYCIILIYNKCSKEFFSSLHKNVLTPHTFFAHYIFNFKESNQTNVNTNKNKIKTRYICLLLVYNNNNGNLCCKYLKERCKLFLLYILKHSEDPLSQLYSFIAFKQIETNFKKFLLDLITEQEKPPFIKWKNKFNKKNELKDTKITQNLAQLQLYLYLNYCLPKNETDYQQFFSNDNETNIKLHFCDKNNDIMLSPSNLMARNDSSLNQTVISNFPIDYPKTYFEVIIITVGIMRIGLAPKQMDILDVVGDNEYSIGIDGYNRCVWTNKKKFNFNEFHPQWNAGDVIGIFVDQINRLVTFGINNNIVKVDNPFGEFRMNDTLSYYVAVSLDQYQQCFLKSNCSDIPDIYLNNLQITIKNSVVPINSQFNCEVININGKYTVLF